MIEPHHEQLSIRRQCDLLGLSRSTFYYEPVAESPLNLELMRLLDEQFLVTPFYGSRRMTVWLQSLGYAVNRKRVRRLMRLMGIEAIYPKPRTSQSAPEHKVYPYLLRHLSVERVNQVWSADITYIPMRRGFVYLVAVMDWYSRYVLAWQLSNTLEGGFCLDALEQALLWGTPDIFNTDQGSQFTALAFTSRLLQAGTRISMDGRGRALDNVSNERLWRTVKYEEVYLRDYADVPTLVNSLDRYFSFYNHQRFHQSLDYRTPADVYGQGVIL